MKPIKVKHILLAGIAVGAFVFGRKLYLKYKDISTQEDIKQATTNKTTTTTVVKPVTIPTVTPSTNNTPTMVVTALKEGDILYSAVDGLEVMDSKAFKYYFQKDQIVGKYIKTLTTNAGNTFYQISPYLKYRYNLNSYDMSATAGVNPNKVYKK